ncbi:GNAT family N-acetyltransferase [Yoonia sp. GPGPB17]|uniref:GNAT family N-acetyltransferase n=1 Tax=Yoonia sp. GPGPB17 TaxID=3026147 RepID=UPI0030C06546
MKFAKQIQTERLLLQPLRKRNLWFFCRLIGSQSVRRYLGGPVVWSQRLSRFRRYMSAPDFVGIWVVSLTERNQPIGLVELGPHRDGKDYEISYQFSPTFWGKGLANEAVQAVISHALGETDLERIIAETQSANSASCRLLRTQGLVEVERVERFGAEQIIFATS